jgi:hypothetical protein
MSILRAAGYTGEDAAAPSKKLWQGCPAAQIEAMRSINGWGFFEDFTKFSTADIATTEVHNGFYWFLDAGSTVTDGDEVGGSIVLTEATSNESVGMQQQVAPFQIDTTNAYPLWFECRFKTSSIADDTGSIVAGLMHNTAISEVIPVTAGGIISDNDFVGWHCLESDGDAASTSYKNGAATLGTTTGQATLVANTYIKLGFHFDGTQLVWYVDGEPLTTGVLTSTTLELAAFPNDARLGVVFLVASGTSARTAEIDWIGCYQVGGR